MEYGMPEISGVQSQLYVSFKNNRLYLSIHLIILTLNLLGQKQHDEPTKTHKNRNPNWPHHPTAGEIPSPDLLVEKPIQQPTMGEIQPTLQSLGRPTAPSDSLRRVRRSHGRRRCC